MSLLTMHRLLIGSGIVVGLLFAIRQVLTYMHSGNSRALVAAGLAVLGAAGLGLYLRSLRALSDFPRPPTGGRARGKGDGKRDQV